MNLAFLGDALDHWKGSLLAHLSTEKLLSTLAVDPMATDRTRWLEEDYRLYSRLLRVDESQIVRHQLTLAARRGYFAETTHTGDLLLDPDTGIATSAVSPIDRYVKPAEVASLTAANPGRLVAVYQHVRGNTRQRVTSCIQAVQRASQALGWCSYESGTVAMLFFSRDSERTKAVVSSFSDLLGRHAKGRVRS